MNKELLALLALLPLLPLLASVRSIRDQNLHNKFVFESIMNFEVTYSYENYIKNVIHFTRNQCSLYLLY